MEDMLVTTVADFEKFLDFIKNEKPKLSSKVGVLGKNDSYKLNQMLYFNKDVSGPNYVQENYPVIDFMFSLALAGRFFVKGNNDEGKLALIETEAVESYQSLNQYEKYVFLLQTFWTKYDYKSRYGSIIDIWSYYNILFSITTAEEGQKLTRDASGLYWSLRSDEANLLHYLRFLGLGEVEEIEGIEGIKGNRKGGYGDSIAFIPNELGISVCSFLLDEALQLWGHKNLKFLLQEEKKIKKPKVLKTPFDTFIRLFSSGSVIKTVVLENEFDRSGVYTFKISISKNCWRKIKVSHLHTLDDLHFAIQDAFDFDNDHLYAFYVNGNRRTGKPIYCSYVEEEGKTAEETTVEDMGLFKGQKIYYLFDFGDMWEFDVDLINIERDAPLPLKPLIIETKGESPDQYGSW